MSPGNASDIKVILSLYRLREPKCFEYRKPVLLIGMPVFFLVLLWRLRRMFSGEQKFKGGKRH